MSDFVVVFKRRFEKKCQDRKYRICAIYAREIARLIVVFTFVRHNKCLQVMLTYILRAFPMKPTGWDHRVRCTQFSALLLLSAEWSQRVLGKLMVVPEIAK